MEANIFKMSDDEKAKNKITALPGSLQEALAEFEKSTLAREALGDHVFEKLIQNKKKEWDRFRIHVSQYETETYLPML